MKLLEGKNILITGASRGIGRSIALECAKEGANVAFTYRSDIEGARSLVSELSSFRIKCKEFQSDASEFEAAQTLINSFNTHFDSLDGLINNAGITQDSLLMRMTENMFHKVVKTNLNSVFNLTQAACRTLIKQRKGAIISMSSVVGIRGNAGQANYAASKAGIIGFTKAIALELGSRNIRANVVAPGFIKTEMTANFNPKTVDELKKSIPLRRIGNSEEVANLVVFLVSDKSQYITGQVIGINGGLYT